MDDISKDKEIDPGRLDVECVQLADRTYHWAKASIEADVVEEHAKFRLGVVEARLDLDCRTNPTRFGLDKVTEGGIKNAVQVHPERIQAYEEWLEARRQSKLLDVAVRAMMDKKHMIQGLITLHGQQYFAGPSVPRDLLSEWKEHIERTEGKVNEMQKARTRKRKAE